MASNALSIGRGRMLAGLGALLLGLVLWLNGDADENRRTVHLLTVDGAIGPATEDYIARGLAAAAESGAELVVLRMDTPGGLDTSMRGIVKAITRSPVPVAGFVAPTGARAASAGTYILYACHVAAMAPGTNLGAATPVQIGGGFTPPAKPGADPAPGDKPVTGDESPETVPATPGANSATERKSVNDAVAYIRGLAELRGRNQEWAEKAVREAASLQASEALRLNVIDLIATDVPDLLRRIDGRDVQLPESSRALQTGDAVVIEVEPDWRNKFLSVITNPNIAYILMLVGIYGLFLEFSNPGALVPGTVGAIALLLALYAFQLLPINYAGIGLILLGVALMVGEAFQPSFGMLGIGGLTAFVIGSVILMDTDVPGFAVSLAVIVSFAVTSAVVFILVVGMALRSRRRPVVSGIEELIGGLATVSGDFSGVGSVAIHSEHWTARCEQPLVKGQKVKVTGIDGLVLQVEPVSEQEQEDAT